MARNETTTTAELYVRSLAPSYEFQSQERVLSLLEELVTGGRLAGYDVFVWGDAICPAGTGSHTATGQWVLDRVKRIERWAADSGAAVTGLRSGEHDSRITGECRPVTRLPSLALAEFDGDDLVHFAPSGDGDDHVSVLSRLDSLADPAPESPDDDRELGAGTEPVGDGAGRALARGPSSRP